MECSEFWERYAESGMNPELSAHLEECRECSREFIVETELDSMIGSLPEHTPPSAVWDRIEENLSVSDKEAAPAFPVVNKSRGFLERVMSADISLPYTVFKYAAVILLTAGLTLIAAKYFIPGYMNLSNMESIAELEDAEQAYLAAIEKFSGQIDASGNSIDPELYDLYMDKLAILDEYILQCKEAVEENELNPNARRYLAMAYVEKTKTLKEMASHL